MQHFYRFLAAWVGALTLAAPAVAAMHDVAEQRARALVRACNGEPVQEIDGDILILVGQPGLLACAGVDPGLFPSPFGDESCGEHCRPKPWAAIRDGELELIVSGARADHGVTRVEHVRSGAYLVATRNATQTRNYLVIPSEGRTVALGGGRLEILDANTLTFLARGRKSYLQDRGAFWYDAVIQVDRMIDILPAYPTCLDREEMIRRSSLDLTDVARERICFEQ
ncbi:MAG: hypothetical protein V2J02_12515 [Pseudomonadales bacterium]|jgi:hypothetical protein|nr:hypothetical protein [Pseudomonadales bacterium]